MTLSARQSPRPPTGDRYCINSCPPLFFDVEIAPEHLGYQAEALLWVTVSQRFPSYQLAGGSGSPTESMNHQAE